MDVTRRCDYACRMIRAVCRHRGDCISVAQIAALEDIPYSFARSIQRDLVRAGLLRTVRGAHGGVALACDPADVTMLDVLEAIEGRLAIAPCSGDPSYCSRSDTCAYHRVWCGADKMLSGYFASITLADLFADDAGSDDASDGSRAGSPAPRVASSCAEGASA